MKGHRHTALFYKHKRPVSPRFYWLLEKVKLKFLFCTHETGHPTSLLPVKGA